MLLLVLRRNDRCGHRRTKTTIISVLLPLSIIIFLESRKILSVLSFSVKTDVRCFPAALLISGTRKCQRPKQTRLADTIGSHSFDDDASLAAATTTRTRTIEWIPTRIEFEGVYRSYGPPSLWRKLTSSVPRREFALQDLTLAFGENNDVDDDFLHEINTEDAVCLLLGASSSGKSTIFRSILEAGTTEESSKGFGSEGNKGSIDIRQSPISGQPSTQRVAKPILLDDRGEVNNNNNVSGPPKTTLREAWKECVLATLDNTNRDDDQSNSFATSLVEHLAESIFDLNPDALVIDLTPSEKYRFCVGKACITSSVGSYSSSSSSSANKNNSYWLPGPILLLDEWMDVETSAVVRKVQPSLHKIVEDLNGIVLSITHKPDLYSGGDGSVLRRITLSAGRLLSA